MRLTRLWPAIVAPALLVSACGGADDADDDGRPTVVVTTSILGDVVGELVGADADVVTLMGPGVSPHDFSLSARQARELHEADAVVVNGGGLEAGLLDAVEQAEADGVVVFDALAALADRDGAEGADPEASASREDHGDHAHGGADDPHFFTDPVRMAAVVDALGGFLADALPSVEGPALDARVSDYRDRLGQLDAEVEAAVGTIPDKQRVLVTNHDVLGYFADRYGFEVVGVVVPGGSAEGAASAGELSALADLVAGTGVPAIFVDSSASDRLAETVAAEVGGVEVVELFTESLGPDGSAADTYIGMIRANADRIVAALG